MKRQGRSPRLVAKRAINYELSATIYSAQLPPLDMEAFRRQRVGRRRRHRKKQHEIKPVSCAHESCIMELRKWMKDVAGFSTELTPAVFHETAFTTQIGTYLKQWYPKLQPQACIAVFLVWERHRHKQSHWYPYITSLPEDFTTPPYFTDKELSYLPDLVQMKARDEKKKVVNTFDEIVTFSKQYWTEFYKVLTYKDYRWAWSVVNTRSVYMEMEHCEYLDESEPNNIALAPFLDLLNHSPTANIKAEYNPNTALYEITTYDSYKPYDQVFISYGCLGSHKLFLNYGFCIPGNVNDEVELEEHVSKVIKREKIQHRDKKINLLKQKGLVSGMTCSNEGLSWKFWIAMETLVMDWDQLQKWSSLMTVDITEETATPAAKNLARGIIQEGLFQVRHRERYIEQNTSDADDATHVDLAQMLLTLEKSILTKS
ncbi:SETD4-like protein [Mya arenaria]|uniref:SETD4-like protein n=1 Tax=Mya arenaria TaxID=6604 RepID=A0ABY7EF48_MYAAR|nr:SETD4-like protein [Mya arenaria]